MNSLDRYFAETGDKPSLLAARIGRPASTITRALKGQRLPRHDLARDVEAATGGRVRASEFMAICVEARQRLYEGEAPEASAPSVDAPAEVA